LSNYFWTIPKSLHAVDVQSDVIVGGPRASCLVILLEDGILPRRRIETNRYLIGTDYWSAGLKSDYAYEECNVRTREHRRIPQFSGLRRTKAIVIS